MSIKEIIDKERFAMVESRCAFNHWDESDMCGAFDRIEAAVLQEIEDLKRPVDAFMEASRKESEALLKMTNFALDIAKQRIAELEAQNLNMMALLRDFYELEFNRDECWEIIKKYGGDA